MAWEYYRSHNSWPLPRTDENAEQKQPVCMPTVQRARELKRMLSSSVSFKDLSLPQVDFPVLDDDVSDCSDQEANASYISHLTGNGAPATPGKKKLIIVLVGLPGRGKTFLCNKLKCYLNWLGHRTQHFNVGQYRREQKDSESVQDASFFDHSNPAGREARLRAVHAALADMGRYLEADGQVAIFDATNSTHERRKMLIQHFHGRWQYMFIESICNDRSVLEQNYRNKMEYSPDYHNVTVEQAIVDFCARIKKYEEVYETIDDRSLHYIKLIDMVTGRGYMDINRISGYIPGKIAFFLMQVCKAGIAGARKIWLTRSGESLSNVKGTIGGNSSLSARGQEYARLLPDQIVNRLPQSRDGSPISVSVWTSTLTRTTETAKLLPFPKLTWKALDDMDAGVCDGMSMGEIEEEYRQEYQGWQEDQLRYRFPRGESYLDVVQRLEPVVTEMERERESIVVVAHEAILRVMYSYFMAVPQENLPSLNFPLHQVVELTPMPDGTMSEERFSIHIPTQPTNPTINSPTHPNTTTPHAFTTPFINPTFSTPTNPTPLPNAVTPTPPSHCSPFAPPNPTPTEPQSTTSHPSPPPAATSQTHRPLPTPFANPAPPMPPSPAAPPPTPLTHSDPDPNAPCAYINLAVSPELKAVVHTNLNTTYNTTHNTTTYNTTYNTTHNTTTYNTTSHNNTTGMNGSCNSNADKAPHHSPIKAPAPLGDSATCHSALKAQAPGLDATDSTACHGGTCNGVAGEVV